MSQMSTIGGPNQTKKGWHPGALHPPDEPKQTSTLTTKSSICVEDLLARGAKVHTGP